MVPPGKFQVLSNCFHPLSVSGKIDWHASDSATCVKPALFGLLCACEVLILRQHTFWHARWDILIDQDA
jgi:hypothetical protein